MKEEARLIIGVKYEGKVYRDFFVKPKKIKDTFSFLKKDEKAIDDQYLGILTLSKQLHIPGIPKDKITPNFILDMYEDDLVEIFDATGRLEKKIARFRKEIKALKKADPGGNESGV